MLTVRWDDGSTTAVDRRRTVGSDDACDTTLIGIAGLHLLIEAVGSWALVEDVSAPSDAAVLVDGAALSSRRALAPGATITVGARVGHVAMAGQLASTDGLLTDRQLDVMACIGDGNTLDATGSILGLSSNTVRSHVQAAYRRLGVSSREAALAVLFAREVFPDRRSGAAHPDGLYAGMLEERAGDATISIPPDFAAWEQVGS